MTMSASLPGISAPFHGYNLNNFRGILRKIMHTSALPLIFPSFTPNCHISAGRSSAPGYTWKASSIKSSSPAFSCSFVNPNDRTLSSESFLLSMHPINISLFFLFPKRRNSYIFSRFFCRKSIFFLIQKKIFRTRLDIDGLTDFSRF